MNTRELRALLERHGLRLHRDRGQNFLVDPAIADRIAERAGVGATDHVVEVGTGLGALSRALAARARAVTTIEVDAGLVRAIEAEGLLPAGVELCHADARRLDWEELLAGIEPPVRVVANLPYSVATPLLRRWLDLRDRLADWTVMVQREVAQRLGAAPGERDYGSLAVLHALCARVESLLDVPPAAFHPRPRVHSRVVRITPLGEGPLAAGELAAVERFLRAVFQQRRKTLGRALRSAAPPEAVERALAEIGVDARQRAESLPPDALLALARALHSEEREGG